MGQNTLITPELDTLPKRLKAAGYTTAGFGKNHVIDNPDYQRLPGNADIDDPDVQKKIAANTQSERAAWQSAGFDVADRLYHDNILANGPRALNPSNIDWVTEGALDFLDEVGDKPFYLYFATTTPHGPYGEWQTGDRRATPDGMLDEAPDVLPSKDAIWKRLEQAGYEPGDRHWKVAGDNLWTDDALGAILDKLEAIGELDNTIVVYFNDHGVESGKTTVYQGGMQSLGVVMGPERFIRGGRFVDSLTSSVDFATTILHWAGADDEAAQLDGVDLRPVLTGDSESVRDSVYGEIGFSRAVRKGDWKYLALREPDYLKNLPMAERETRLKTARRRMIAQGRKPFPNKPTDPFAHIGYLPGGWDNTWSAMKEHPAYFDVDQLYNLAEDPDELHNLAADPESADKLVEMQGTLSGYLKDLPGSFGEFTPGKAPYQAP